ncbi:hypothetical protein FA13DRAFT_1791692 [Coprinellus micaceus]|uniref:Uncharacterized protein n=1 Tax=Coprinellus micaceus TaxID=71717 RepID=A0A4Y7TC01_COPMI|nr:hypothetical protein FA13DRAFT_1791692 [Coprinellus micaceus]
MGKTPSFVDLMMSADMHFPVVPTLSMLKSMAAALFDRTSRVRASQFNDGTDFLNHQSATIMLQRLRSIVPPFAGRPAWAASPPFLDMDLFTVHTILHTCTMQLDEADYAFLDPVVTICWSKAANHLPEEPADVRRADSVDERSTY